MFAGFWLGAAGHAGGADWRLLGHTVLGAWLVASGAAALNQAIEWRSDMLMRRTARRPIASGRIEPVDARRFGMALSLGGLFYLIATVNLLATVLAALTLVTYLFVYTPLKRRTALCTLAGAIPGAAPPLIGYAGAAGTLGLDAWLLYAVVFCWQFPHVMAIAWMYRGDYARAGYRVLPPTRAAANRTLGDHPQRRVDWLAWQIVVPSLLLIPLTLIPLGMRDAGPIPIVLTAALGGSFAWCGASLARQPLNSVARRLLFASIVYLPAAFALLIGVDRWYRP